MAGTVTDFLRDSVSFLKGLSNEEAHELAAACEQADFASGETIIRQGTTVEGLHVVATGKVEIWVKLPNRTATRVVVLGPGEVFGEASILESGVAMATIKAAEETHLFIISQDVFRLMIERKPEMRDLFLSHIKARREASMPPKKYGS